MASALEYAKSLNSDAALVILALSSVAGIEDGHKRLYQLARDHGDTPGRDVVIEARRIQAQITRDCAEAVELCDYAANIVMEMFGNDRLAEALMALLSAPVSSEFIKRD